MSDSLAGLLRASVENASDPDPLEVPLPVFDPPVTMRLSRIKDALERDAAMEGVDKIRDEGSRALEASARLLAKASVSCYVEQDGEVHELPRFGLPLWQFIYGEAANPETAPQSEAQAVFALYTDGKGEQDTAALVDAANSYVEWSQTEGLRGHEAVLKN